MSVSAISPVNHVNSSRPVSASSNGRVHAGAGGWTGAGAADVALAEWRGMEGAAPNLVVEIVDEGVGLGIAREVCLQPLAGPVQRVQSCIQIAQPARAAHHSGRVLDLIAALGFQAGEHVGGRE